MRRGGTHALRRDPSHFKARNNLGFVYDSLGEPEKALEEYKAEPDFASYRSVDPVSTPPLWKQQDYSEGHKWGTGRPASWARPPWP